MVLIVVGLGIPWTHLVHVVKEKVVGLVLVHDAEDEVHCLCRVHVGKKLPEYPDPVGLVLIVEQVVAACT